MYCQIVLTLTLRIYLTIKRYDSNIIIIIIIKQEIKL